MSIVIDLLSTRLKGRGLKIGVDSAIDRFTCKRSDEQHIEAQEFGECTPPLACRFSKASPHVLAVADEDGGLVILNTKHTGIQSVQQDWLAHKNAVFDIDWVPQENQLVTASGDQTVVLWDVEAEEKMRVFRGHTSSVKTIRFTNHHRNLFATGARDGHIMLYDTRVKEKDGITPAVNVIHNAHKSIATGSTQKKRKNQDGPQSVTSVLFQDENTLISAGSVDGSIRIWDLRKTYTLMKSDPQPRHAFNYAGSSVRTHGFSSLVLDSTGSTLYASCMDSIIYKYDTMALSNKPFACYSGHKNSTFYIKTSLSPDETYLLSGSADNMAYIWKVSDPSASPWTLQGHCGEVSAVDWCPTDLGKMVTISDDSTVRIWRLGDQLPNTQAGNQDDLVGHVKRIVTKEKGVLADLKKAPLTPRKGPMVPPSPAKVSTSMRKTLAALSDTTTASTSSNISGSSASVISPSIANWFGKGSSSQKLQPSPLKKTPRKLLITPKKQTGELPSTSSLVLPGNCGTSSVKRKLYDPESPESNSNSKRQKTDNFFMGQVLDENSCDGYPDKKLLSPEQLSSRVPFMSCDENKSGDLPRKSLFSADNSHITPIKTLNSPKQYQSPTMNLPNYVFDPVQRTPLAKPSLEATTPKTPDWLTQISKLKRTPSTSQNLTPSSKRMVTPSGKNNQTPTSKIDQTPTGRKFMTPSAKRLMTPSSRKAFTPGNRKAPTAHLEENDDESGHQRGTQSEPRPTKAPRRKQPVEFKRRGSILQFFSPGPSKKE